jgi:ferredoxin
MIAGGSSHAWSCRVSTAHGTSIRKALLEAGLSPYNKGANVVNCRGIGTCGTCAIIVSGTGFDPRRTIQERTRLALPPHRVFGRTSQMHMFTSASGKQKTLRLACQCRLLPGAEVLVEKPLGFWGHRGFASEDSALTAPENVCRIDTEFDYHAIRQLKPYHDWLKSEMRSNQVCCVFYPTRYDMIYWVGRLEKLVQ